MLANDRIDLDLRAGEVHALLGENGAGKSTLMGVAAGTTKPDTGTIEVDGEVIDDLTPAMAGQLGIAIVHQHPAVLPDMTVAENLRVAIPRDILGSDGDERSSMRRILADVNFTAHLDDRVNGLTVAQKHLLELAKALAIKPLRIVRRLACLPASLVSSSKRSCVMIWPFSMRRVRALREERHT